MHGLQLGRPSPTRRPGAMGDRAPSDTTHKVRNAISPEEGGHTPSAGPRQSLSSSGLEGSPEQVDFLQHPKKIGLDPALLPS